MRVGFKLKAVEGNGLLAVTAVFLTTFYVYKAFGLHTTYGWSLMLACCAINAAVRIGRSSVIQMTYAKWAYLAVLLAIVLFMLRPESRRDEDTILYVIAMSVMFLVVVLADPSLKELVFFCRLFAVMSLLIALWILFFKLFPAVYWATVYKVISAPCQELASYYMPKGYGVPLGGSYTIAYYIMIVGALTVLTRALNGDRKNLKTKLAVIAYLLVIFAAMIAEGRRGEMIAAVAAIAFVFIVSKNIERRLRIGIAVLVLVVVFVLSYEDILAILKQSSFFHRYALSLEGLSTGADITSGRLELWALAVALFCEHPIIGIGYGGYAYHVTDEFRAIHGQDVMTSHNCILDLLCENGIIGTLMVLIPLGIVFWLTYRHLLQARRTEEKNIYVIWACRLDEIALGIQFFFFVISMLDPAFFKPVFWGFYGASVVLAFSAQKLLHRKDEPRVRSLLISCPMRRRIGD